ncbi:MAG: long-chain fatty acid--CoA ligase [Bdellovibrionota bacterium]
MTVSSDWLKKWSRFSPKSVAFKDADSGRELTYGNLYFSSCRLATELESRFGVSPGDRVAVLATNELEYPVLFFALQRLGAMMVPVNFRLSAREISHVLGDSEAKLLVSQSQFDSVLASATGVPSQRWAFDGEASLVSWLAKENEIFALEKLGEKLRFENLPWEKSFSGTEDSECMVLYTSGTTGAPKGALITNRMLLWNSINTTLRLNLNQSDVTLSFLPFFHTGGWNVLLTPFVHRGAKTIIMKKFDATRVLELCESERATILFGVPTTMAMMTASPGFETTDLSSLRYAIVGGEPMAIESIHTWQRKGVAIRQGFGLTEFGPNVFSLNEEDAIRKIGSIGFANFYIDVRVVDDDGRDVPQGHVGELVLRGPVCTPGYWKNPEATANAIKDGWFYTGDLVRADDEGYFFVAGRKKDMFISGGENVYPIEVEQCLSAHPSVREVAVVGIADDKWGEVGKAFISLHAGANASVDEILGYCQQNLAKFKIPKHVAFLPELPKGDSGKILKRSLRDGN